MYGDNKHNVSGKYIPVQYVYFFKCILYSFHD